MIRFFVGLHQPSDAQHFDRAFISVNRLRERKSGFAVNDWIMDSGAFTEISKHGHYRHDVSDYAAQIRRWHGNGNMLAAVAQDYMCEPFIVQKTGLSVERHQQLTIERYDALIDCGLPVTILPVLQGWEPSDYRRHIEAYGDRLAFGQWIGVGSICKRNSSPIDIANVLGGIKQVRPDLRLHGFGLKITALLDGGVRALLDTADSMSWSFAARYAPGRSANDWREAKAFEQQVNGALVRPSQGWQPSFVFRAGMEVAA